MYVLNACRINGCRLSLWLGTTVGSIALLLSSVAFAQDASTDVSASPPSGQEETEEATQVINGTVKRIQEAVTSLGLNPTLANQSIDAINQLLVSSRADQAAIYSFVRTVNRNIDSLDCAALASDEAQSQTNSPSTQASVPTDVQDCQNFKRDVRTTNRYLRESSYTDEIFQNDNLSNQIKVRMPLLIEDSLLLGAEDAKYLREDFLTELELFSDRFLRSRRFRAGFGLAYSYLPSITYQGIYDIDLSPFQSRVSGGADRLVFSSDFSNRSFPSFNLSAKVPYVQIDAYFPSFDEEISTQTPVIFRDIDDTDTDVLARSTIASKLSIEFEASVRVSLPDLIARRVFYKAQRDRGVSRADREKFHPHSRNLHHDFTIGVGMSGFRIVDNVTTDVRFRSNGVERFDELPLGEALSFVNKNSFNTLFYVASYSVKLSDELQITIDARSYDQTTSSNKEMRVDDLTVSMSAVWYPTFPW